MLKVISYSLKRIKTTVLVCPLDQEPGEKIPGAALIEYGSETLIVDQFSRYFVSHTVGCGSGSRSALGRAGRATIFELRDNDNATT